MNFRQALSSRPLVLDGSMGALLQKRGLPAGMAPDVWMLGNRSVIRDVAKEYREAGADIILTNTFGASKWRLEEYDAYADIKKINAVAVDLVREGAPGAFVAGDIGPSGETIYPTGAKPFDEVCEIFYEQAKILVELGVDLIAIETMFDSLEYRCALSAVRAASLDIPVVAFATFNTDGITDTGASPENIVAIAEGFHIDAVGLNCSVGPDAMVPVVKRMAQLSNLPVAVQPNAGLPLMRDGETVFPLSPTEMAPFVTQFLEGGARIIGGCCGTRPEFTKLTRGIVDEWVASKSNADIQSNKVRTIISSLSGSILMGGNEPFVGIGEKMNPSGRKKLSDSLKGGDLSQLMMDAELQINAGGKLLDLNVGVPLVDEPKLMGEAVVGFQNKYPHIPLMLDSANSFALDSGASVYYGRPLMNSINAEDEKIEEMLPIIRRHGGAVVCLLTGVEVPEKAEERIKNAIRTFEVMEKNCGIKQEDVVFDCLGLVISAMQEGSKETLRTIQMIKEHFPRSATTLGLSNTSFGLPNRRFVHSSFMVMAIQHGLDSAIMSVTDKMGMILADAASMWGPKQNSIQHFIENHAEPLQLATGLSSRMRKDHATAGSADSTGPSGPEPGAPPAFVADLPALDQSIFKSIVGGDKDQAVRDLQEFVKVRSDESMKLFMEVMTPAIRHLGDLFAKRIKFIPHLISAADAMKAGVAILEPHLIAARAASNDKKGCVIFATVKGDIHDIGKNICVLMLRNFGYEVIDLGRNVDADVIIQAGIDNNAQVLALSALMTTTMIQMKVVIDAVKERELPFKVVIGGAVVTPEFAREIEADGYSTDVGTAVNEMERVIALLEALDPPS